jgi:hypothetical protein
VPPRVSGREWTREEGVERPASPHRGAPQRRETEGVLDRSQHHDGRRDGRCGRGTARGGCHDAIRPARLSVQAWTDGKPSLPSTSFRLFETIGRMPAFVARNVVETCVTLCKTMQSSTDEANRDVGERWPRLATPTHSDPVSRWSVGRV